MKVAASITSRTTRVFEVARLGVAAAPFVLWASLAVENARADDCFPATGLGGCVDSDELWAHAGSSPFLAMAPSTTTPEGRISFGLALSYSKRPILLRVGSPDPSGRDVYLVDNLLDATFVLALGVTDRFELTLAAPMTLYEDGAGVHAFDSAGTELPRSAVRDGRFGFSYAFLAPPRTPKRFHATLVGRMELAAPYGTGDAFARSRTATLAPTLTGDIHFGRLDATYEVGARLRDDSVLATTRWGSEIEVALGVAARIWDKATLDVSAEAFALPSVLSQPSGTALVPSEWLVDLSSAPVLDGDVGFQLSGGGALPFTGSAMTAPLYRLSAMIRYAPGSRRSEAKRP